MINIVQTAYGVLLCVLIGILAVFLTNFVHTGAVPIAIIIGMAFGNTMKPTPIFSKGIVFSENQILSFAIMLMGINLNYLILEELGFESILLIIAAMVLTLASSIIIAMKFKFNKRFALLLGIGNGVCGTSAIAATKKIIGVKEEEVGLSVAIIHFLGTIGIFLLPFIGAVIFKFTNINSGILIGNTLQAVGHVAAGGFSLGEITGQTATIVKMARILMLTPIVIILIFIFSKNGFRNSEQNNTDKKHAIPIFIGGFILFSIIPTFELLSQEQIDIVSNISQYALIVAMAGIGLKIKFVSIFRDGRAALLIGTLIFSLQIIFNTVMVYVLFN